MLIPEFWCGVISTILVEVGLIVVAVIVSDRKEKK